MVKRQCPKCNALFDRKSHYDYHINRKFDCSQNNERSNDITNICENLQEFAKICENTEINQKNEKIRQENEEIHKSEINLPNYVETNDNENGNGNRNGNQLNFTNNETIDKINETYPCSYCQKKFSTKYTLGRHMNESCKAKKESDNEKENIFKMLLERDKRIDVLEKQNQLLMDKIDKLINMKDNTKSHKSTKTTNNTNTNNANNITTNSNNTINKNQTTNTQNNIVMVNFGKEDLSVIDEKQFIDRIVKNNISGVKIPDEVLKIIHFNPQYPQLSNIYISDINREKCMVYEDGEWKLSNVDNIPQIMDKVCVFSSEHINNLKSKHPNNKPLHDRLGTIEKYNNMIDGDYVDDLRDEGRRAEIARCEEFQEHAYNTLKKTMYNEGKKIKKNLK